MFIGIDIGLKGGLVAYNGTIVDFIEMPTIGNEISIFSVYEFLKQFKQATIVIEKPIAMPGQSSKTTLTTGINYGALQGAIQMMQLTTDRQIHVEFVSPITWAKAFQKGVSCVDGATSKVKTELALKQRGEVLPPEFYNRNKKVKDGLMDALAIAIWRRNI